MSSNIDKCEQSKRSIKLSSESSYLSCYKYYLGNLCKIPNFGDLEVQHALMALMLTRVTDIPQLARMAVICPKTNTYKHVVGEYGVLPSQLGSLLITVASLLGVDRVIA
jgi:hypothetical protein